MENDEAVLAELKKMSAWADTQRKLARGSLIFLGAFVPIMVLLAAFLERRVADRIREIDTMPTGVVPERAASWYDVDQSVRQGDVGAALRTAQALLAKTPNSPEAHRRLAGVHLAAGDIEKAQKHYSEAFRLFPSEEHQKLLQAAEMRIWEEKHRPAETKKGQAADPRAPGKE